MSEHHIPKGVSLDTLQEIVAGWHEAGATEEPQYTADVESVTSVSDVVGRQTRFLEEVDVLKPHRQKHRLTEPGAALATALSEGDQERAREQACDLLADWSLTEDVRDVVEDNPLAEDDLVPIVADLAGHDLDVSRVETGVRTLLALYEWTGLLERDAEDRYLLPESGPESKSAPGARETMAESRLAVQAATETAEEAADVAEEAASATEEATAETAAPGPGGEATAVADQLEQTIEDVTEQTVAETAEEVAREVAEETAEEVAVETAEEVAEETATRVAREVADERATEAVRDTAEDVASTVARETASNVVEETTEDIEHAAETARDAAQTVEEITDALDGSAEETGAGAGTAAQEPEESVTGYAGETAEAVGESADGTAETAGEAATGAVENGSGATGEASDATDGSPAESGIEIAVGDEVGLEITVDEDASLEIGLDGDVDLRNLDLPEGLQFQSGERDGEAEQSGSATLETDGGVAQADVKDEVELTETDQGVRISVNAEPGITISIDGEESEEGGADGEEASADAESAGGEESAEGGDEEAVEGEESSEGEEPDAEAAGEGAATLEELADGDSPEELVAAVADAMTDVREAATEAKSAAEEARTAARQASEAADTTGGSPAISLDVDIDPQDLEALVEGIRGGLQERPD